MLVRPKKGSRRKGDWCRARVGAGVRMRDIEIGVGVKKICNEREGGVGVRMRDGEIELGVKEI